jgi:hypothetical protein
MSSMHAGRCSPTTLRWLVLIPIAACTASATEIDLSITAPTGIEHYELRLGDKVAVAEALPELTVQLSDAMEGPRTLEVWGLVGGEQAAFGTTSVTPIMHATVHAAVVLTSIQCGTFCNEGTIECSNNGTITCQMQPDGCLAWSAVNPCPASAPSCSNGTCSATCTDECSPGQTTCDTTVSVKSCGQFDSDSCLDWSPPTACPNGQTCSNGSCGAEVACAIDGMSCDDGNACTVNDTCEGGACSGTAKCTSAPPNADPTCASDGTCGFVCHSGYVVSGSGCVPDTDVKRMFVTSTTTNGAVGGLAKADAFCQNVASNAALVGTYKAWLSDSMTSAATRLTHAAVPYALPDGTIVAGDWTELTSGLLRHTIDLDEHGMATQQDVAWTSTNADGTTEATAPSDSCSDWTSTALTGLVGTTTAEDSNWSVFSDTLCTSLVAFFCVQQ